MKNSLIYHGGPMMSGGGGGGFGGGAAADTTTLFDLERERFLIVGHRGDINAWDGYPENTVASMVYAAFRSANRVECDVRQSSDGTWYLMHDATVDRTTNGSGNVSALTDAQLDALWIDGGYGYRAAHAGLYHPPKLVDVLTAIAPYNISIQVENLDYANYANLAAVVVAAGYVNRAVLNSNTDANAQIIKGVDPRLTVMAATGAGVWTYADIYQYIYGTATEAIVLARAPKPVSVYVQMADYGVYNECAAAIEMYNIGVRYFTTNWVREGCRGQSSEMRNQYGTLCLYRYVVPVGGIASWNQLFPTIFGFYRNLRIMVYGKGDNATNHVGVRMRINADAGNNYDYQLLQAQNAAVTAVESIGNSSGLCGYLVAASGSATNPGAVDIMIPDWSGTVYRKQWYSTSPRHNTDLTNTVYLVTVGGKWRSNVPITRIELFPDAGNFAADTIISVYGMD